MLFISSFGVAARESEKPSVVNFSELISMILGDLFPELFPVVGKKAAEIFKPVDFRQIWVLKLVSKLDYKYNIQYSTEQQD